MVEENCPPINVSLYLHQILNKPKAILVRSLSVSSENCIERTHTPVNLPLSKHKQIMNKAKNLFDGSISIAFVLSTEPRDGWVKAFLKCTILLLLLNPYQSLFTYTLENKSK